MKKRSRKYNPNKIKVNSHAAFNAIKRQKPLTIEDQRELCKSATAALNAMQFGKDLAPSDFTVLCDVVNISLVFTESGLGKDCLPELYQARDALQNSKERYISTGKLGFSKPDLDSVKVALGIHQLQLEVCTLGLFEKAFDEQNNRIKSGIFYKRDPIEQKIAA